MDNFKYDYYRIFNITSKASDKLIKYSYKELLSKYHPDISKDKDSLRKTQIINEGYDILINHKQEYNIWHKNNVSNTINRVKINKYFVHNPFNDSYITYDNESDAIAECRYIRYELIKIYKELNDELENTKKKLNKSEYIYKIINRLIMLVGIIFFASIPILFMIYIC